MPGFSDLPKIINKTSAPKIFDNDTSILFAHSNLIDFNKNICIVFATLSKWFTANQLSLNFNKTNYAPFTTKRNMSVNFKIDFNNNLITNSSYTNFLVVTMDNILSCKHHIDLLIKNYVWLAKYSKTCLKRNAIVSVFFFPFSQVSVLQRVVF